VGADVRSHREGDIPGAHGHGSRAPTGVGARGTSAGRGRELGRAAALRQSGGRAVQPAHREEAQRRIGSRRPPSEPGRGVTPAEPRGAHGAKDVRATPSTPSGGAPATPGLESLARRARREPGAPCTALRPHGTVEHRRACVAALDGTKAPGLDGVTKEGSGPHRDEHRQALPRHLRQRADRPHPVRRVDIPQAAGPTRPLGSRGPADTLVQERTRRLLEAMSAPGCYDTSAGVRPGWSGHEALRRLTREVMSAPVTGRAERDLAQWFATLPHMDLRAVLAERLTARRCRRRIARRLTAGVQTPGGVVPDELGRPPGSMVAPVIATGCWDKVLDPWGATPVKAHGRGDVARRREADETRLGCARAAEAPRVLRVLPVRLAKCGWRLNAQHTRLGPVGPRAAWRARQAGRHPPTCDCRGCTQDWGRRRRGLVRLPRQTSKKRLRRAWVAIHRGRRQERHARQRPDLWQAMARQRRGPFNALGVTDHRPALWPCDQAVQRLVCPWWNRRRQRRRFSWARCRRYAARYPLPRPGPLGPLPPVWRKAP
jgi:RNA-directed DNA polymerase